LKRFFMLLMTLVFAVSGLSGCGGGERVSDEKISVVCTMFSQYDWTREIIKGAEDKIDLELICDNGSDFHSYQPTADDIIALDLADIAIYTDGASDGWVSEALKKSDKRKREIRLLEIFCDEEIHDDVDEAFYHEHKGEYAHVDYDEHVWLSIENAEEICEEIAEKLIELDPENKILYNKNLEAYKDELERLDDEYEKTVRSSKYKTLLFADRFPFKYLLEDYNIAYYAAFPGCSAESEASFETVAFLSKKLEEEKLPAVMTVDNGSDELAKTVINNAGAGNVKIISMNSLQSTTKQQLESGMSYLSAMRDNLSAIKEALN